MEDEPDDGRSKLTTAWRAVGNRLLEEGYAPADVTETMLSVALASWSSLRGREAAARHLRTVADHLLAEHGDVRHGPDVAA
jgi:hypothetical protein